ncbi:MAG: bifunctional riboflavin kinase/FMN adenylyltransferase [Gammaproteobacteria bacterium]|nr:bifunctional riboflavin kinase/FMN adenylyltransferase [Gammaproteobacteria bacterium]|tara:strand:+ start:1722 stop:2606 length:885 start_codon:yes stop_codon:yes gene_type:complete
MKKGYATTIGNFDGLHQGHMALIAKIKTQAKKLNLKTKIITFNPYPFEFFKLEKNRILSEQDKNRILSDLKIDCVNAINFSDHFRNTSAEDFFSEYLLKKDVKYLIVGKDFKFGKDRSGDLKLLKTLCDRNEIILEILEDFEINGSKISSTLIRELLQHGKFQEASKLLGRTYQISGKVIKGKSLGKRISTPTANIDIENKKFCFSGVFLCKTEIDQISYFCIVNFGTKPTFDDYEQSLEVHILDYDGNIYDEALSIEFLCKIRDQIKFNSIDELKNQINEDKIRAEELKELYE